MAHGQVGVLPQLLHSLPLFGCLGLVLDVAPGRLGDPGAEGVTDLAPNFHLHVRVGSPEDRL